MAMPPKQNSPCAAWDSGNSPETSAEKHAMQRTKMVFQNCDTKTKHHVVVHHFLAGMMLILPIHNLQTNPEELSWRFTIHNVCQMLHHLMLLAGLHIEHIHFKVHTVAGMNQGRIAELLTWFTAGAMQADEVGHQDVSSEMRQRHQQRLALQTDYC